MAREVEENQRMRFPRAKESEHKCFSGGVGTMSVAAERANTYYRLSKMSTGFSCRDHC